VIIHGALYKTCPAPRTASSVSRRQTDSAFWLSAGGVPLGEIDIVARPRQLLVFVEVKARASLDEAAESVNEQVWLAANPDDKIRDIRFDAILVAPGKIPHHIPAAFQTN
jgi:Uncharacterised protein family UPF0102